MPRITRLKVHKKKEKRIPKVCAFMFILCYFRPSIIAVVINVVDCVIRQKTLQLLYDYVFKNQPVEVDVFGKIALDKAHGVELCIVEDMRL